MYNCYNQAVEYLNGKYNGKYTKYNVKKDEQVSIITHDDLVIKTLLGQYYYGIEAKKELYFKLVYMNIMGDHENRC